MHKVSILPATDFDAEAMLAIYAPFVKDTAVSFEEEVPSLTDWKARIHKVMQDAPWLVCHLDGQVAGYAYASAHRDRAAYRWNREFSVYVHPAFHRRKVAHALYAALSGICALQGYTNALAGIALPNEASERFHESCGFVKAAQFRRIGHKLGRWHDVGWWEWPFGGEGEPGEIRRDWRQILFSAEGLAVLHRAEAQVLPPH